MLSNPVDRRNNTHYCCCACGESFQASERPCYSIGVVGDTDSAEYYIYECEVCFKSFGVSRETARDL